ncbi:ArdC family protein [Bacteroidales bacterium OttesenSCG-928-C03]|nr:ArdC family protein [Bacteroidales bacterium OttesenSCG-928-C03]MDL2326132.1 ArdC family protein [Bacteroidales bacterium OttesenSCG-928-A14]
MKNIDLSTGEIIEFDEPQANEQQEEKKELSNREMQFKRLLNASAAAKTVRDTLIENAKSLDQALYYQSKPLNHYILNYIYKTEEITDFKKFREWKSKGATIKKGEKAYPIWGQPVARQKENAAEQKGESYDPTPEEEQRFPMCYVFSNLQVVFKEVLETVEP